MEKIFYICNELYNTFVMVKTVNLRGINYLGSVRDKKGFCHFPNVTYEFRAFTLNLLTKLKRFGKGFPRQYISTYAPSSDGNDTERYYNACAALLDRVKYWYDKCVATVNKSYDEYLCSLFHFYTASLALYRCQQVLECGYNLPEFSEPLDFTQVDCKEFTSAYPGSFGVFWQLGSPLCVFISWLYYSHYTLSNKWLLVHLYTYESSSVPSFKCQFDLYNNDLNDIISQLRLECVSDENILVNSRYYGEQVRKFPISKSPKSVTQDELKYQKHPSASRFVTLHFCDHSDPDEVFPFPLEEARP